MASTITVDKIKGGTSGVALTLPTTDGSAGQLLKTDGSAVLGWATDAGGIASLAADTTPQLGGFLDANGNYMQTEKGADIVSASPLVITTVGDYFDVTGTVSFAAMTVAADRQFTLQFDGILTMTHHATNLDLPGEANITTAVGDVATFQSTGANTVQCINYTKANGESVVAAAGGKVLQVVSDFSATRVSVSTSTWTNVGLSVTITPSATTSKILLISSPFTLITGSGANLGIRITRGSTGLISFENITERWNHDQGQSISLTYMDNPTIPGTPVAITYTVQGNRSSGSGTCYFIQDRATTGGSSLIALEIGA